MIDLLLSLALQLGAPAGAQERAPRTAVVVLPMEAYVTGREILLGEVAEVRSGDAELDRQLGAASLGYAPSPGYSRLIFHYRIEELIERRFEGLDLTVTGERSVRVWPKVEAVEEDAVRATVEAALRGSLAGRDVELAFVGLPPRLEIPAGSSAPRLQARFSEFNLEPGIVEVPVDVFVDEARYRTLRTQVELIEWQLVPVLERDVPAGQVLAATDFAMARVRATGAEHTAPLTMTMAHGAIAGRALRKGDPVRDLDVHRPLAVSIDQAVTVEVRRGAVVARSMGVALGSGSLGERVRVRLLETGREMRAVIQSRDSVVVDLGGNGPLPVR